PSPCVAAHRLQAFSLDALPDATFDVVEPVVGLYVSQASQQAIEVDVLGFQCAPVLVRTAGQNPSSCDRWAAVPKGFRDEKRNRGAEQLDRRGMIGDPDDSIAADTGDLGARPAGSLPYCQIPYRGIW